MYKYWKSIDDKLYSFNEAVQVIEDTNGVNVAMQIKDHYGNIKRILKSDMPKNIGEISLPFEMFTSTKWQVVVPDFDMEKKRDEIKNYCDSLKEFNLDTRFHDPDEMSISDWFTALDYSPVFTEEIIYDMLMYLRDNKKLPTKY